MATFFDLFEDGKLDVLALEGNNGAGYKLSAYTNTTQDSDAYFIKVVHVQVFRIRIRMFLGVPDPHPYVFWRPGSASGFVSHKYGCGSGSESFPFLLKVLSGL
jgi:hypothetical protein